MGAVHSETVLVSNVGEGDGSPVRGGVSEVSVPDQDIAVVLSVADRLGHLGESLSVPSLVVDIVAAVWGVDLSLGQDGHVAAGVLG